MKKSNLTKAAVFTICIALVLSALLSGCAATAIHTTTGIQAPETTPAEAPQSTDSTAQATSYNVTIDVNPSIELKVVDGLVSEGVAYNDDGANLLLDINVVGLSTSEAVQTIIKALVNAGYIANTEIKPQLILTVANGGQVDEVLAGELEKCAQETLATCDVECKVMSTYVDDLVVEQAAALNLSVGRYLLLNYIAGVESITIEESIAKYSHMKIGELMEMFEGAKDLFKNDLSGLTDEQLAILQPALEALKQEMKSAMDAFHKAFRDIKANYKSQVESIKSEYTKGNNSGAESKAKKTELKERLKELKVNMLTERRSALDAKSAAFAAAKEKFLQAVSALGIPSDVLNAYLSGIIDTEDDTQDEFNDLLQEFVVKDEDEATDEDKDEAEDAGNKEQAQNNKAGKNNKGSKNKTDAQDD